MKEHQVKIQDDELLVLAHNSLSDLGDAMLGIPDTAKLENALERVNYFAKRYIKNLSGKPDIQTETSNETAEAQPNNGKPAEGWN